MEFCLNNEKLCVRVSSLGAELRSVRGADGTEYLWQGDERFWRGRATNDIRVKFPSSFPLPFLYLRVVSLKNCITFRDRTVFCAI